MHPDHGIQAAAFDPCQQGRLQRPCVACRDATVELRPGAIFPCGDLDDAAAIAEGIVEFPTETREVGFIPAAAADAGDVRDSAKIQIRNDSQGAQYSCSAMAKMLSKIPAGHTAGRELAAPDLYAAFRNSTAEFQSTCQNRPTTGGAIAAGIFRRTAGPYSGRGRCGCLGGTAIRGADSQRVGSGNRDGSGNLFSLRSQEAK